MADNGFVIEIGVARTPWVRGDCPRNMNAARQSQKRASVHIHNPYRIGLQGLSQFSHVHLIGLFRPQERAEGGLPPMIQYPEHVPEGRGVFALRSPLRPNPLALSIAKIVALDAEVGLIELDALDWYDGTPLLDIKPYFPSTDAWPDARVAAEPGALKI